nr:MAG TPA: hypothetical protein [Caudoviricetes sp.]
MSKKHRDIRDLLAFVTNRDLGRADPPPGVWVPVATPPPTGGSRRPRKSATF